MRELSDRYDFGIEDCLNLCEIFPALLRKYGDIEKVVLTFCEKNGIDKIKRIYIGSSFCGNYFIKVIKDNIRAIEKYCFEHKVKLTLVIPIFLEKQLDNGKELLFEIVKNYDHLIDEFVVNDVGMLHLLIKHNIYTIFLGRLMRKTIRDPRYPIYTEQCYKESILMNQDYKKNILGVEIDANTKKIDFGDLQDSLVCAIHTPMIYITTGQLCDYAALPKKIYQKFGVFHICNLECNSLFLKYASETHDEYYRIGKTIYYRKSDLALEGVSRLRYVHFPLGLWEDGYEYISSN